MSLSEYYDLVGLERELAAEQKYHDAGFELVEAFRSSRTAGTGSTFGTAPMVCGAKAPLLRRRSARQQDRHRRSFDVNPTVGRIGRCLDTCFAPLWRQSP